jgi:hypothetical protein
VRTPTLVLLGVGAVALLVALTGGDERGATPLAPAPVRKLVTADPAFVVDPAPVSPAARASLQSEVVDLRASEAELRAEAAEESYARLGGFLVDHLVARGLAPSDGERVVRRFLNDSVGCLFDALRVEANTQSVDYEWVLDAMQANLHATDGPMLAGLLDMAPVVQRVGSCNITVAQQAGLEPSAFAEATRAAIGRAR